MPQPHKNLFFYYRGSRPKGAHSDIAFERQLEDNATKALVYVLEHADRSIVLGPFLQKIASLRRQPRLGEIQFALQRSDIRRPSIPERIALSIAPIRELKTSGLDSSGLGRPDAWIWEENRFAVLIETKTKIDGQASKEQIHRHIATADGWSSRDLIRPRSWSDVYKFLQKANQNTQRNSVSRLLLDEMTRYLRMIGLSTTTTFDLDDFGYFIWGDKDRHSTQRLILKKKLEGFVRDLIGSPAMRNLIGQYAGRAVRLKHFVHPGVFRKDAKYIWITVGRKEWRNRCHFNIRLTEQGIALEAFSPHRSYTRGLIEKVKAKPAEFVAALKSMKLKEPFFIRLREAYYRDPKSPYKGQRIKYFVDHTEIHPSIVTKENVGILIIEPIERGLKRSDLRPEIFVVRNFLLSELVGNSKVVDLVASTAKKMLPFLNFALDGR